MCWEQMIKRPVGFFHTFIYTTVSFKRSDSRVEAISSGVIVAFEGGTQLFKSWKRNEGKMNFMRYWLYERRGDTCSGLARTMWKLMRTWSTHDKIDNCFTQTLVQKTTALEIKTTRSTTVAFIDKLYITITNDNFSCINLDLVGFYR